MVQPHNRPTPEDLNETLYLLGFLGWPPLHVGPRDIGPGEELWRAWSETCSARQCRSAYLSCLNRHRKACDDLSRLPIEYRRQVRREESAALRVAKRAVRKLEREQDRRAQQIAMQDRPWPPPWPPETGR